MGKRKNSKSLHPTDAHRKALRKKEQAKNKRGKLQAKLKSLEYKSNDDLRRQLNSLQSSKLSLEKKETKRKIEEILRKNAIKSVNKHTTTNTNKPTVIFHKSLKTANETQNSKDEDIPPPPPPRLQFKTSNEDIPPPPPPKKESKNIIPPVNIPIIQQFPFSLPPPPIHHTGFNIPPPPLINLGNLPPPPPTINQILPPPPKIITTQENKQNIKEGAKEENKKENKEENKIESNKREEENDKLDEEFINFMSEIKNI